MNDLAGTTVLVTDVERRKAVPVVRSLGRAGVRVVGLSAVRWPLGGFSKHCAATYRNPDYEQDPEGFLKALEAACRRERPDTLIPLEEESLRLCLENRSAWQPPARAVLPAAGAFARTRDKGQTVRAAREAGVPVPETHCPASPAEAEALFAEWAGPAVVKPRKSSGSRGLRFAETPAQLRAAYREVAAAYSRPLVQERLPAEGAGLGVFFLMDEDHEPVAQFGHRRLREYPVGGGPSTLRESHRDEALIAQSLRLLQRLEWTGVAMVEYKVDVRTGTPALMEINPRFWGSLPLALCAGVNFPLLYHRLALGQSFAPVLDFDEEAGCRWLWPGDILHFLSNPDRLRLEPSFFNFWEGNTSYDILSRGDPGPALGMVVEAARKLVRGR
jgi:predicted ATP-grasp superfamily ATP-dependent carboligase